MRFYFDLTDGLNTVHDDEGILAEDLQMILQYAEETVNEMRQGGELVNYIDHWRFVIRTETGTVLATIQIS
ncbi:DUF6894 family protein [Methylobacterium oryzisoli]|uniref:DUF6894 family protein n=1 Tax=Methylobacterium oryzisoli TaxID=3385502 RepID=UPI003891B459